MTFSLYFVVIWCGARQEQKMKKNERKQGKERKTNRTNKISEKWKGEKFSILMTLLSIRAKTDVVAKGVLLWFNGNIGRITFANPTSDGNRRLHTHFFFEQRNSFLVFAFPFLFTLIAGCVRVRWVVARWRCAYFWLAWAAMHCALIFQFLLYSNAKAIIVETISCGENETCARLS